MSLVRDAFAEQLKEYVPEDFFYYYVAINVINPTDEYSNMKLFACNSLDDIETNYNLLNSEVSWPYPVLVSKTDPTKYPHIESQRTTYSLDDTMDTIRAQPFKQLEYYLNYVFYDTSTDFMVTYGMPTHEDVKCWMLAINERTDLSLDEKTSLITTCINYINGV
jgi:hypothetical protein